MVLVPVRSDAATATVVVSVGVNGSLRALMPATNELSLEFWDSRNRPERKLVIVLVTQISPTPSSISPLPVTALKTGKELGKF